MSKINWMKELGWNEDHLEDLRMAGFAYIRQGKYTIAEPFFKALTILDPDNSYDTQTMGALYLELGQPEKALAYFDKALKMEADHTPTLLNLCKALFMLHKVEEGLRLAQILQNDPNMMISNTAKALILAYS